MSYLDLAFRQKLVWVQPIAVSCLLVLWLEERVSLVVALATYWGVLYATEWVYVWSLDVPSYRPTPVLGVRLWQAMRFRTCFHLSSFHDWSVSFARKRIYNTFLWHSPVLSVSDVSAVREMLVTKWRSFDRAWYEISAFSQFLGGGLILARNDKWSHTRPAIAKMFGRPQLKLFAPVVAERTEQLVALLEGRGQGCVVDMQEQLLLLSFDTIVKKSFGVSEERSKLFSDAFHTLLSSSQAKMLFPFLRIPADRVLFFLPTFRNGIKARELLERLIREHVLRARREPEAYRSTILGKLLEEGATNVHFREDALIVNEMLTVLFASHDTTAAGMTFCLYYLARNPEAQQRCREEAQAVWDDRATDGEALVRAAEKLHFLRSCFREALRLKPSAPLRGRTCVEATTLTDDDGKQVRVAPGQLLLFSSYNIHHNELYFANPDEFRPDRWDNVDLEQQHTFLAFGAGPRKCPGELLAFLEASIVLARLLRSFSFHLEDPEPVETHMQLTLVASHLRLKVLRV